jgi:hypothetical protein
MSFWYNQNAFNIANISILATTTTTQNTNFRQTIWNVSDPVIKISGIKNLHTWPFTNKWYLIYKNAIYLYFIFFSIKSNLRNMYLDFKENKIITIHVIINMLHAMNDWLCSIYHYIKFSSALLTQLEFFVQILTSIW